MKRILAVAVLLTSFASIALADGPDLPPPNRPIKPPTIGVVYLADGPDLPPPGAPKSPKPPSAS